MIKRMRIETYIVRKIGIQQCPFFVIFCGFSNSSSLNDLGKGKLISKRETESVVFSSCWIMYWDDDDER